MYSGCVQKLLLRVKWPHPYSHTHSPQVNWPHLWPILLFIVGLSPFVEMGIVDYGQCWWCRHHISISTWKYYESINVNAVIPFPHGHNFNSRLPSLKTYLAFLYTCEVTDKFFVTSNWHINKTQLSKVQLSSSAGQLQGLLIHLPACWQSST